LGEAPHSRWPRGSLPSSHMETKTYKGGKKSLPKKKKEKKEKKKKIKGKKKRKKRKKKKKKEGKKEKITLCFLLKSTKCNIYRYHTDPGPGSGGSGPVKHREEGRRVSSELGRELLGPIPSHHSILPMTTRRSGGCSQAYPSPIPGGAGLHPS